MKRLFCFCALVLPTGLALDAAGMESYEQVPPAVKKQMEETTSKLVEWLSNVDKEAFRPGQFLAKDELVLKGGAALTGKLLDYGPYVCFIDQTKRSIIPRGRIQKMTASWGAQTPRKPNIPDLDVTYIERLPRYRGNHGNVGYDPKEKGVFLRKPNTDPLWPPRGTRATFKGHVVNKGPVESKPFRFEWLIDGAREAGDTHRALKPAEEVVLDFEWRWQDGPHEVTLKLIPDGPDFSAWNNAHTDRTDSLGFLFVLSQSTRDGFDKALNMVESFSCEDWVQYHFQVMNFLFAASIHPGSPQGCFERVRVDWMVTYPDNEYREKAEKIGADAEGYMLHEGKWGLSPWDKYDWRATSVDWGLIHELGHQLGIIDYYTLDFWRYAIFARDKKGDLLDVGYSYPETGMMRGHGPHPFEEATAIAMNWERGKHRGYFGDYLFKLPRECGIRILDWSGKPIPGADLRIFRRMAGVHTEDEGRIKIPEDPAIQGTTDADGVFMLPNEKPPFEFTTGNGFTRGPSPFGDALVICDTGLMLIEIWKNGRRDAQFTDVTQFMIGRGRGHVEKFIKDIPTILPGENDPVKPPKILSINTDGWCDRIKVTWENVPKNTAVKFRMFTFRDGLPFDRVYLNEVATLNAQGPFALSVLHLNGWLTMTGIDADGNESGCAVPQYVGWRHFGNLDVDSRNNLYYRTEGSIQRIEPNGTVRLVPTRSSRGFWPAVSVAVGPKDELFLLSREYGAVEVMGQDSREIRRFGEKGSGDGQLAMPSDIDLDRAGNAYIADTENNRIAVFGPDGKFIRNVGAGKIEKPVAVEVDIHGNLYVIESKKPGLKKLAKEGDAYRDPVLLIETKSQPSDVTSDGSGRIFVSQNADPGLLILDADGKTLATLDKWGEASTREIAGMVADRAGFLACGLGNRGVIVRIPMNEIIKKR